MHRLGPALSGYRAVWLFAMFDLPVATKADRKRYSQFRKQLLKRGFSMLQFSVYARYCSSEESAGAIRTDVRAVLPPKGQVRLMAVTDHQFGRMEVWYGRKRTPAEEPARQFMLF